MKWTNIIVCAPILSALVGCIDGPDGSKDPIETGILDTDPTTDTDTTDTDATDTDVVDLTPTWDVTAENWADKVTCEDGVFTLTLSTVNWGYEAELYLGDTRFDPPWEEAGHMFTETAVSPDPTGSSEFSISLTEVGEIDDVVPGSTTLHDCEDLLPDGAQYSITYAVLVKDSAGAEADCIVFGHDPAGLAAGTVDNDGDGVADELVPPTWVNDSCRVLQ